MLFRLASAVSLALTLVACGGATSRHLIAEGDEVRVAVAPADPATVWSAPHFSDGQWQTKVTAFAQQVDGPAMPTTVSVRRVFDVGADCARYRQLTLSFSPGAAYDVYLNGQLVGNGDGQAKVTLNPPAGLLHAAGNVLGLEVHATQIGALTIAPVLDGEPDPNAPATPAVARGPWLIAPSQSGVTIVWETNQAIASSAIVDGQTYDGGAGTHHTVTVSGLLPAHAYTYRIAVGDQLGEENELTTAPADKSSRIRFVAYGDNRTDGDAHRRVVDAIRNEGADFVLNTGDMVNSSSDDEWQTFFDIEYSLLNRTPMYPSLGNHEANSGGGGRFAELFPLGRAELFSGRVYSFDYGSVHVAVLDSNGALAEQADWLEADLTQAEAAGARHLFVVTHWGAYSGRNYPQHGSNAEARSYIVPVARRHNVDALLAGHDHFYERGSDGGLHYFVTGGGGAPLVGTGSSAQTEYARSVFHYIVIDVVGSVAHAVAKDATGTPFDAIDLGLGR